MEMYGVITMATISVYWRTFSDTFITKKSSASTVEPRHQPAFFVTQRTFQSDDVTAVMDTGCQTT
jgi:hypothetical protein